MQALLKLSTFQFGTEMIRDSSEKHRLKSIGVA
jgi:hypothetical protein